LVVWLIFPGLLVTTAIALGLFYVVAISALKLTAAFTPVRYAPRQSLTDAELPVVSVVVALHDEADSVAGLIAGLECLDYPAHKLEILLALEAHDHLTRRACNALLSTGRIRVLSLPPLGPMTKPRALNAALALARGELIAVYDAEDCPAPEQIRAAAEAFTANPRLGVLQAPLGWYNRQENWLTAQFGLEYAAHFHALLPIYDRMGCPLPLGGTSNVFRRDALDAVSGWDAFNVTEDADLGLRLARSGWQSGLIEPVTLEESPISLSAWITQRSRWLKGHAITWLVHMRDPRGFVEGAGWRAQISLQMILLANVLSALLHLPITFVVLTGFVLAPHTGHPVSYGLWLTTLAYFASMACAVTGARRAGFRPRIIHVLSMPLYWMLQLPAALKALHELPRKPYLWRKTQHGVSTADRTLPDVIDHHSRPDGRDRLRLRTGGVAWRSALKSGQAASDPLDPSGHR